MNTIKIFQNKQVAKEQAKNRELELKVEENECERLKVLLYNAITLLKNAYNIDDTLVSIEKVGA